MSILAFLVSIIYVPGWTGVSLVTGWAFLSATLPLATWRPIPVTPPHVAGALFLGYAALSLLWAPDLEFGVFHLWQAAVVGFAFVLGSQLTSTRSIVLGLALGAGVSSVICIVQALGFEPVMRNYDQRVSGLFYNSVACASFSAFVLIWLLQKRMWWFVPLAAPAAFLPLSRGAYATIALYAFLRIGWFGVVLAIGVIGLFILDPAIVGNSIRVKMWLEAIQHLSLTGYGVGAIESIYLNVDGQLTAPENLHNEFLDLAFHYGIFAALPVFVLLAPLACRGKEEWYPYVCFLFLCLFSFPLHIPPLAFAAALCAGHLSLGWSVAWADFNRRRPGFLSRACPEGPGSDPSGRKALSVQ